MAKHGKPKFGLSASAKIGKKYKNVSITGLWPNDGSGPKLSGGASGTYLSDLRKLLKLATDEDATVYFQIWDNSKSKKDDDEEDEPEEDEEDEKDEEEDEDEKPKKKSKGKKKSKDDDDDEDPF
jgi:hypothetical protein